MERNGRRLFLAGAIGLICLGLVSLGPCGCAASTAKTDVPMASAPAGEPSGESRPTETGVTDIQAKSLHPAAEASSIRDQWGIEVVAIRFSAAGQMLDFRYRVLDPGKAAPILDPKNKAHVIDQKSGATLVVPRMAKVGSLRQTSRSGMPETNRVYFILFGNPGARVKPGDKVTVIIGDFGVKDLTVQ